MTLSGVTMSAAGVSLGSHLWSSGLLTLQNTPLVTVPAKLSRPGVVIVTSSVIFRPDSSALQPEGDVAFACGSRVVVMPGVGLAIDVAAVRSHTSLLADGCAVER